MNTIKNIVKLADTLDEHDLQMAIFALEDMALEKDLKSIEGLPEGWSTKKTKPSLGEALKDLEESVRIHEEHNSLCKKWNANMFKY